jgi:hypothetical protein
MQGLIPLMPYFPLVLSFCRRYVTGFGVGTLMSLLLPFGTLYLLLQIGMLLAWSRGRAARARPSAAAPRCRWRRTSPRVTVSAYRFRHQR